MHLFRVLSCISWFKLFSVQVPPPTAYFNPMLLLIDNYDSFVHNLARYLQRLGQQTQVVRNDAIDVAAIRRLAPQALVLSPGPCTPREAGVSLDVVRNLHTELPILGVCLGHQVIAEALGGTVLPAKVPMHGRTSPLRHTGTGLFRDLPSPMTVCRYHSLVVEATTLPHSLQASAWTRDDTLMAVAHTDFPVFGVQFHPEAILTEHGYPLLGNFLRLANCPLPESFPSAEFAEMRQTYPARYLPPTVPVTF